MKSFIKFIHFFNLAISKINGRNGDADTTGVDLETVFELTSLILYGAQAIPIRLKIMLDRLLAKFSQDEVLKVISNFGWSYQDYARGYILSSVSSSSFVLFFSRVLFFKQ